MGIELLFYRIRAHFDFTLEVCVLISMQSLAIVRSVTWLYYLMKVGFTIYDILKKEWWIIN